VGRSKLIVVPYFKALFLHSPTKPVPYRIESNFSRTRNRWQPLCLVIRFHQFSRNKMGCGKMEDNSAHRHNRYWAACTV